MQVVSINNVDYQRVLEKAIEVLKSGGVIAYPTETTYGLGCDPRNHAALDRIYRLKERDNGKALPLIACSMEQVEKLFKLTPKAKELAEEYWPGPLTLLLEPADMSLRKFMPVFKDGLTAVRVSSNQFASELACVFGFPIVATSANISGDPACLSAAQVMGSFMHRESEGRPDLIVDGGELEPSEPSTIVKFEGNDAKIVRQGAIRI
ncbi:MAG: L-threonylcarbamoyladenylate synthase [Patescibacteria group bacterium]|nr:L-threonylcarbamoyladenylate synthase [Patescibacteria group bacterium]